MVSYAAHSVYQQIMLIFTFDADLDKAALLLSVKAIIQIKLGSSVSTFKHPLPVLVYTVHFEPHYSHCIALNLLTTWYHGNHLSNRISGAFRKVPDHTCSGCSGTSEMPLQRLNLCSI